MQPSKKHIEQQNIKTLSFPTDLAEVLARVESVNPLAYGKTRNYKNGAITYLSPYISRGLISTKTVYEVIKNQGIAWYKAEKLIQELAWRDYWQQQWIALGNRINDDLRQAQQPVDNWSIPAAINHHQTGIDALDKAIESLYNSGYMHNHMRMYLASVTCNVAQSHWLQPAKWLFYHLLDGDWASNALSWQWVAGSNANKKYYCNQQNINRFFDSHQRGTFLDTSYEQLYTMEIPKALKETELERLYCALPDYKEISIDQTVPTLVYNYYNLDPYWKADMKANRILLLEPSFFGKYPISPKCMEFFLDLSQNIEGIQVYVGTFETLYDKVADGSVYYKEHPDNQHYEGIEDARTWLSSTTGFHRSFFSFWKKCKKELKF
jgi:deoxyribodipyrimidine photo-lyase